MIMRTRLPFLLTPLLLLPVTADAAVLCAKARSDGTFNATVKVREVCKARETQLTPEMVGWDCSSGLPCTTTTTATTGTTEPQPSTTETTTVTATTFCTTTSTGFNRACGGVQTTCSGGCPGTMTCSGTPQSCGCVGTPPPCDTIDPHIGFFEAPEFCGYGVCPVGQSCGAIYDTTTGCRQLVACGCH
jgi:hypothetical protein